MKNKFIKFISGVLVFISITNIVVYATSTISTEQTKQVEQTAVDTSKEMALVSNIYYDTENEIWTIPDEYYATKSMQQHLDRLNQNLKPTIKVNILDRNVILQKSEIANMTDVNTGAIDYNKLYSWCKYIADSYGSGTTFRSWNGEIVQIPTGDYGAIEDTFTPEDLMKKVYPALLSFKDITVKYEPALGSKYIECDLTNQKIFWYENVLCTLSTDCVTGKVSTPTPTGTYSIKNVLGRTRLKGETWDCYVNNWSLFYDGCGLHDATWQSSFGLARWQAGYGSHGCVNLPLSIASEMKNHMEVGEPIIVYTR